MQFFKKVGSFLKIFKQIKHLRCREVNQICIFDVDFLFKNSKTLINVINAYRQV